MVRQPGGVVETFFWHGIQHIPTGYDHLLYVSALVLAAATLWDLVKITAFTLAHSITLTLSALNLVYLPERIVEPEYFRGRSCWRRFSLACFMGWASPVVCSRSCIKCRGRLLVWPLSVSVSPHPPAVFKEMKEEQWVAGRSNASRRRQPRRWNSASEGRNQSRHRQAIGKRFPE
jgi:hypothetical protein